MPRTVSVTLDDERVAKLARLAERMDVEEGTLASVLLAVAIDQLDVDERGIADLLDAIPGAHGRARLGIEQARRSETTPLHQL
jgi:hypothetical protein